MLPKLIFSTMFLTFIIHLTYGWTATVYQYKNFEGEHSTFSGEKRDCKNFGSIANFASSINTYGSCVKLWTEWNCEGGYIQIAPGTPDHYDFTKLTDNRGKSIDNNTGSIGGCDCSVPPPINGHVNYVSYFSEANYCGSSHGTWPNHPTICTNIGDSFQGKALSLHVHNGCVIFYEHKDCTGRSMKGEPDNNEIFTDLSRTYTGSEENKFFWGEVISSVSSCDYDSSLQTEGICQQDGIGTTSVRKNGEEYACLVIIFRILQSFSVAANVLTDFQFLVENELSRYGTIDWCAVKGLHIQHFAGPRAGFNEYINALTRIRDLLEQWFVSQDHWYYTGRRTDVLGMINGVNRVIQKRQYDIDNPKDGSSECVTRHREILEYWRLILALLNEWRSRWGYS